MRFADRTEAGRLLAGDLTRFCGSNAVILGLPRGGVPVAFEVAMTLGLPLDVILVRKLGVPSQPELAMGALGEGGVRILNDDVLARSGLGESELHAVEGRESAELARRAEKLHGHLPRIALAGRPVVIVDDGLATGATMRAACRVARAASVASVTVAVPVGPPEAIEDLRSVADEVVVLRTPERFGSVGSWYATFHQTADATVIRLLDLAASRPLDPS